MNNKFFRVFLAAILSFSALFMTAQSAFGADQDFTTYDEVDNPSDRFEVTGSRVAWDGWQRTEDIRVYKDFGENYFAGGLNSEFTLVINELGGGFYGDIWSVSNAIKDHQQLDDDHDPYIAVTLSLMWGTHIALSLGGHDTANSYLVLLADDWLLEPLYCSLFINGFEGDYGVAYLNVYSNVGRTNSIGSTSIDLAETDELNYRYFLATNGYDDGDFSFESTGYIENLSLTGIGLAPSVITYPEIARSDGVLLGGYASSSNTSLIDGGFNFGTSSGVYTANWSDTSIDGLSHSMLVLVPSANLTIGNTYYYRAWAENGHGIGYGSEDSFLWSPQVINVIINEATVTQSISGNFSASLGVFVTPSSITYDDVGVYLSPNYPPYTDTIELTLVSAQAYSASTTAYTFSTWNGTFGDTGGLLLPETTYYYQGFASYNGTLFYSTTKSFETSIPTFPDKPTVEVIKITDVSETYQQDYTFEIVGKIGTSNTTDHVINQGIRFSMFALSDGTLLPNIESYLVGNLDSDGTYIFIGSLEDTDWYNGETLYFQATALTTYYDTIVSATVPFTFVTGGTGIPVGEDDDIPVIGDFADVLDDIKAQFHLYGVMGTWAFLGLILLAVALIFGVAIVSTPDATIKKMISIVWGLISFAVLGAFLFTGQLGIWPILIIVGGVVVLIFIITSTLLSGGGSNG